MHQVWPLTYQQRLRRGHRRDTDTLSGGAYCHCCCCLASHKQGQSPILLRRLLGPYCGQLAASAQLQHNNSSSVQLSPPPGYTMYSDSLQWALSTGSAFITSEFRLIHAYNFTFYELCYNVTSVSPLLSWLAQRSRSVIKVQM